MKDCPVCGKSMPDMALFCPNCGAMLPAEEGGDAAATSAQAVMQAEPPAAPGYVPPKQEIPPQEEPAQQQTPPTQEPPFYTPYVQGQGQQQPPYTQNPQQPYYAMPGKDPNRPLSTWAYALALFLMGLPVVGLILQIVWAVGGTSSINRQNLARGYLFLRVCIAVIAFLLFVVLAVFLAPYIRQAMEGFPYSYSPFRAFF